MPAALTNKSPPAKSVPVEVLVNVVAVQLDAVVLAAKEAVKVPELVSEEKFASNATLLETVPLLVKAVPAVPLKGAIDQTSEDAIWPPNSFLTVLTCQTTDPFDVSFLAATQSP